MDIAGSIALVAGGASGPGLAVTSALHEAGASVVILDGPGSDGAAVAAALGPRAMFSAGEASSPADVDAALDAAGALAGGVPRIVVTGPDRIEAARAGLTPLEDFAQVINVSLIGTFNVIRLAADRMSLAGAAGGEPGGDRGVIITSAPADGPAAQVAAAAGIAGLTRPLARDLAAVKIRVVTVAASWSGATPGEYAALVTHIVRNPGLNGTTIQLGGTG
jgi:NAD(P)-dependent dehydrogenase (short-subunit alcohol dehydrogenase family)